MINLIACAGAIYWARKPVKRLVSREPFLTLGAASMEVFCTHLLFVFVGLAMLYNEVPQLHGIYAILLLAATFGGLLFVATRQLRNKQKERINKRSGASSAASAAPSTLPSQPQDVSAYDH